MRKNKNSVKELDAEIIWEKGDIQWYINSGKQEKLQELLKKVADFNSRLEKCWSRKAELSSELKHEMNGNLKYWKTKEEVEKLGREIDLLWDKKSSVGRMTAFEADLKKQRQKKERLLLKLSFKRYNNTSFLYIIGRI